MKAAMCIAYGDLTDAVRIVDVGAGVEYRGIPLLALRGGANYITGGTALSVGAGLRFGRYELGAAIATQQGDNKGTSLFVNLFSLRKPPEPPHRT